MRILIISLFLAYHSSAQSIQYTYDMMGNRTMRGCISCRYANSSSPKDSVSETIAIKYGISVYPNPATQMLNVFIGTLQDGQNANIYLFDAQGKIVVHKRQTISEEAIFLSGLSSGIYQLRVIINDEQIFYRIIKL